MRSNITIQRTCDQQYLGVRGLWLDRRREAQKFENSHDAVKYCIRENLPDVQIVFSFENPAFDFAIKVRAAHEPS